MKPRYRFVLGALFGFLCGAAPARAETTLCKVISSLPYTITAQGSYCLDRNLSTAITAGAAIRINVDFVVLDLNGFKVGGGGAGFGTQTNGVFALNRKNVTVKNGNIRGFYRGVYLQDNTGTFTTSQGHLVEDIRGDQNTFEGIHVEGRGIVVRNNQVVDTTGTTVGGGSSDTTGIVMLGPGGRILNNDVADTVGVGSGVGRGISVANADGAVVENNRAGNATLATGSIGIHVQSGDDVLVVGNRIAAMDTGLLYEDPGSSGKFRDNLASGCNTPYNGGTVAIDAGNNN